MTAPRIRGIHHVTAIAGNARRNLDFYTRVLGLRFIKKTVNFDDPGTYHFYFGNETGEPGTVMTFFPWEHVTQGRRGIGQVTETAFSVPEGSFDFWVDRFKKENVIYNNPARRFNEQYLTFIDPDGLKLELVIPEHADQRKAYVTADVQESFGLKGFHGVTLSLDKYENTARILTDIFGYKQTQHHVNRFRFETDAVESAAIVDLVNVPGEKRGVVAGGSVHHVAFRVSSDEDQLYFREKVEDAGLNVTPQIDRDYFKAIYFREPGGVLFEIATEPPGFTVDEPLESLGTALKLPKMYEPRRKEIESVLPELS